MVSPEFVNLSPELRLTERARRYRRLALELGDAIKGDVPVRSIDRAAQGILALDEAVPHPNAAITSERAQHVYDWVLTLLEASVPPDDADTSLTAFVRDLCGQVPEGRADAEEMLLILSGPLSQVPDTSSPDLALLHPLVLDAAGELYAGGHYDPAVFEAFKALEVMVRQKAGLGNQSGRALMFSAFDAATPKLLVADPTPLDRGNRQEGFRFMIGGAMQAIRNVAAHGDLNLGATSAYEHLAFASLLVRVVEAAQCPTHADA